MFGIESSFSAAGSAVLAIACAAGGAAGQARSLVVGRTVEFETDLPLAGVEIQLLDSAKRLINSSVTDSAGRFRLESRQPGSYNFRAQSIGYRTVLTPVVELAAGDTLDVIIRMSVDAVPLAPLEVAARAAPLHRHPGLARFHERAERGMGGRFILTEEIGTRGVRMTGDLLITAGAYVVGDPFRGGIYMKRLGCAPTVYIDGMRVTYLPKSDRRAPNEALEAVNLLPPSDIEGIEVYPGPASVPAEFASQAGCGVVAIWTRRG